MSSGAEFARQVAVITGAGEGIGYEIARQLALNGASILLNDVDESKAQRAAANIEKQGGRCLGVGGDVGAATTVSGLVDQAVEKFGRIDIAVANAGVTLWNKFLDYEPESFFRVLSVNLGGSFFLAQAAARQMRSQGTGGRILFMSSVTAYQAIECLSAYSMTKAALKMLTRQLVVELSPLGITVNAIAPGAPVTPRNLKDDADYEKVWGRITPTGRSAFTHDVAHTALFLLSPLSEQITGQTIVVDGGWTATSPVPPLDFVEDKHEQPDRNTD